MGLKAVAHPAAGGQPGSFTDLTVSGNLTLSGGTDNGIAYLNGSKVLTTGSDLTWNGVTLGVAGPINASGGIESLASVSITKDGSDSIGSGPLMQVRNAGATRSWAQQLSASNNLDWWHLDGSWTKYMTLSTAGLAVTGSISATASVRPQADPDTNWGIDFAQSNSVANFLTLADAATYDLAAGSGLIILHSNTSGSAGVFLAAAGSTTTISDPDAQFSTAVNTPAKINFYYNSTTAYRIQNNTGGAIELFVAGMRTRTNT